MTATILYLDVGDAVYLRFVVASFADRSSDDFFHNVRGNVKYFFADTSHRQSPSLSNERVFNVCDTGIDYIIFSYLSSENQLQLFN